MSWHLRYRSPWQSLQLMVRRRLLRRLVARPDPAHHARFALLAGDVVSEEVRVAGLYEAALLQPLFTTLLVPRLASFKQQAAVDVGANIGNHSLFFARHFARVLAVEPNPTALALLRCNVALSEAPHVEVIPVGLGERDGAFAFTQNTTGNLGGSGFAFAGVAGDRQVNCELRRGDDVLPDALQGLVPGLVKLDVEGAELAALDGMAELLRRHQPVLLFESNRAERGEAVMARLRQLGYRDFWAVEERGHAQSAWRKLLRRLAQGECIEVKPITALEDRPYAMLVAMPSAAS